MNPVKLHIDYCSYEAAKYAVIHWHYSKCIPLGKLLKIGVWENDIYIGCIIYSMGTAKDRGRNIGLKPLEVVELTRVALNNHKTAVTKLISYSINILKKDNPKIKLIISFADINQGHLGKIYQAGNWIYTGFTSQSWEVLFKNKWVHPRSVRTSLFGFVGKTDIRFKKYISSLEKRKTKPKFRYLYPLDKEIRKQVLKLAKPYPKSISGNDVISCISDNHSERGGAVPTLPLNEKTDLQ